MGGRGVVLWWFWWLFDTDEDDDDDGEGDGIRVLLFRGKYLLSWCLIAAIWAAGLLESEAKTILSS